MKTIQNPIKEVLNQILVSVSLLLCLYNMCIIELIIFFISEENIRPFFLSTVYVTLICAAHYRTSENVSETFFQLCSHLKHPLQFFVVIKAVLLVIRKSFFSLFVICKHMYMIYIIDFCKGHGQHFQFSFSFLFGEYVDKNH